MDEPARTALAAWESFYIIVGSSAGALTGLQFVVMAVIADSKTRSSSPEIAAFGTPTILHFCAALLISALLSAPWPALSGAGLGLALCGLVGMVYAMVVVRRARRQQGYRPVLEDWVWHAALPLLAYAALLIAAVFLSRYTGPALAVVASVTLLLVFIGIHNAWDTVTYVALDRLQAPDETNRSLRRRRR
jgi:divalent metal cation (Fe/Co/Zn/Cd) transporter